MKRFTQCICLILIVAAFFTVPALAAEDGELRASNYFMTNSQYLYKTSNTSFDICFDVTGVGTMEELGASKIILQRSSNGSSWSDVETYTRSAYPEMIDYDTVFHACSIPCDVDVGYYYRIYIRYYAKKGSTSGEFYDYSTSLYLKQG